MDSEFKALRLSYKNAPLEVREKVALSDVESKQLLNNIREYTDASDVLVLSTCNRTEIYFSATKTNPEELIKLLCLVKDISFTEELK
jgi:glutamyl-tRNA reductase